MGNGHCVAALQGEKVKYMIMKTTKFALAMLLGIACMITSCMNGNKNQQI